MYNALVTIAVEEITALSELLKILFWVARVVLLLVGGGAGLYLIVNGKSGEQPQKTMEGFMTLGLSGTLFAATFAVEAIFK